MTIGVLSRLTRALDRATRAGAFTRRSKMPLWLTEFGIQSTPDRYFGVSLAKQVEYRAIAERMAWSNPRVRAFSQYLLRDDRPIEGETRPRALRRLRVGPAVLDRAREAVATAASGSRSRRCGSGVEGVGVGRTCGRPAGASSAST